MARSTCVIIGEGIRGELSFDQVDIERSFSVYIVFQFMLFYSASSRAPRVLLIHQLIASPAYHALWSLLCG
jgi:hypothetical protein